MYSILFFITFISSSFATTAIKTALPLGGSTTFTCKTDTIAIWTKADPNGHDESIAAGVVALAGVDKSRYSFTQKGTDFTMTIKDIQSDDAGKFICNSIFEYDLIVIEAAKCQPNVNTLKEDEHFEFSCQSAVKQYGDDKAGKVEWMLGKNLIYGEDKTNSEFFQSSVSYTAKYLDHGKKLQCYIDHPNWDSKFPRPTCSFGEFNVQFEPKVNCPSTRFFMPSENQFLINCTIIGNPLPSVGEIKWKFEKNDERRKFPSFSQKDGSIEATLKLTKHHLSARNSNLKVMLQVPNKLDPSKPVTKSILARYVHGPDIVCNKNLKVSPKKNGLVKIKCDVFVNPIPPNSNISWFVDDDFIQRQRSELLKEIPNGVRVGMELQADQYGKDSLKVTLKISGLIDAKGEIIQVTVPHMQRDENPRQDRGNENDSFVNSNNGLLLLGGGTFFLMLLTVIIASIFYKKGFFSSNGNQYGTRAVIAQGTMADSDFFGVADKGFDSGTFRFYQPKNTLDPHGTMTMKLMKQIKDSDRDSEWTEGFAKMANALYLKDTDQDGYLTVLEAKPVVMSYSDIYHLGFTENKLDEVFMQCSNGQHVDVETLLRMISLPTSV